MEFIIRNYFIAPDRSILVWQDADQQEYRMLGHYSNDQNFKTLCKDGYDIHKGTGALLFNKPYEEVTDDERSKGKTGNFATVYGIGNPHLANSMGYDIDEPRLKAGTKILYKLFRPWKMPPYSTEISEEIALPLIENACRDMSPSDREAAVNGAAYFFCTQVQEGLTFAKDFKKKYFGQFPDINKFLKECAKVAEERGYIRYWTGRRRHFHNPKEEAYKAPNSLIQGGCAEIIKIKMHEVNKFLHDEGYRTRIMNNVHDELCTCHPIERKEIESIMLINEILRDLPFRVPITWGIDWGYKWGEKKPFESIEKLCEELGL